MIWHLVAVFITGLGCGGIAFLAMRISRGRLPTWIVPVAAGVGMLGYQIYYDYSWFDFKQSQLPEGAVVIESSRTSISWKPWTYLLPLTTRFSLIDDHAQIHERDGERIVHYMRYTFFKEYVDRLETRSYLLNCASAEQVQVDETGGAVVSGVEKIERSSRIHQHFCR